MGMKILVDVHSHVDSAVHLAKAGKPKNTPRRPQGVERIVFPEEDSWKVDIQQSGGTEACRSDDWGTQEAIVFPQWNHFEVALGALSTTMQRVHREAIWSDGRMLSDRGLLKQWVVQWWVA